MLIRDKIILIFTFIVICILSLFSFFVYYFYSLYRQQEFEVRLVNKAKVFANVLISRDRLDDDRFTSMAKKDLLTIADEHVVFLDENKNVVFSNREKVDTAYFISIANTVKTTNPVRFSKDKIEGYGMKYTSSAGNYYVIASGYDDLGGSKINILKMILIVGNLIACVITIISAYYFSGRLLKPIKKIVVDVNSITEKNLDRTIDEGNGKDEFSMLSQTFNQMLLRLRKAFDAQKSFIAHASHQLRTPLTNMLGTLQTSLSYDKEVPEMRASMESGVEELKYLIELTNNLLAMTKAEESSVVLKESDLDLIVLQAREQAIKKFASREVLCEIETSENADSYSLVCNKSLMATAIYNVLDNALKYSTSSVHLELLRQNGYYVIRVSDQGPGIPEGEINSVFGPLYRGSNTKNIPGYGIGLALTQKIIHLHGGKVTLQNRKETSGLEAVIRLGAVRN